MGICSSCDVAGSAVAASPPATAKLIFPDGRLEEHPGGKVPAAQALGFAGGGGKEGGDEGGGGGEGRGTAMFICSADEMEFGGYVTPLCDDEVLQPGQIYFALPRSALRRAMAPEDMAALAVRASAALVRSGCEAGGVAVRGGGEWDNGGGERKCEGTVPAERTCRTVEDHGRRRAATVAGTGSGANRRRKMSRGRSFSSDLLSIPE